MKNIPYISFFVACIAGMSSCSSTSASSQLEEALAWVPANTKGVGFDNWVQIKKDFNFTVQSLKEKKWMPQGYDDFGNEIPGEKFKDNLDLFAAELLSIRDGEPAKKLGFEYPDLQWELLGDNFHLIKFNDDWKRDSLDALLKELSFSKEAYKGYEIYASKPDLEFWMKKGVHSWMVRFASMCYVEEENMLIAAPFTEPIKKAIDAHESGNNFIGKEGVEELVSNVGEAENVQIFPSVINLETMLGWNMHGDAMAQLRHDLPNQLGISKKEIQTLHKPGLLCIAVEKMGKVSSVLYFTSGEEAGSDLKPRLDILKNGRSLRTQRRLRDLYYNPGGEVSGNCIVFNFKTLPSDNVAFDFIMSYDIPWAIYVGEK